MVKKSAAKIRRNASRAAARGEEYTPPPELRSTSNSSSKTDGEDSGESDEVLETKFNAAQKLQETLAALSPTLNAKERRSAKRKAEAIAVEESGCGDLDELMEWYNARSKCKKKKKTTSVAGISLPLELSEEEKTMFESAKKLHDALSNLENDTNLNAKERRSAKRKAEAIASEEIKGERSVTELLQWYETMAPTTNPEISNNNSDKSKKIIPYIIFVGQLSYTTTSDMLFQHFQSTLGSDVIPNKECMKIRLLTDSKTHKSRGMAFIELESPEVMYECLKLHLTHLDGRRINVERSAGGGTATKKARISSFRESQSQYISETIDNILASFTKNGEIEAKELDEGVIALCKRHSASVVEAALREYVEEKKERKIKHEEAGSTIAMKMKKKEDDEDEGLEFRNPSAFLTHMIGRIAEEGIGNSSRGGGDSGGSSGKKMSSGRGGRGRVDSGRGGGGRGSGSGRGDGRGRGGGGGGLKSSPSILQQSGVDMGISSRRLGGGGGGGGGRGGDGSGGRMMERIFPSMSRGRGRGRGYM